MLVVILAGVCALLVTCLAVGPVMWLARRSGCVSHPVAERWHQRPTPMLGGLAMAAGVVAGAPLVFDGSAPMVKCIAVAAAMALLGGWDDFKPLRPAYKLLAQVAVASAAVLGGLRLGLVPWEAFDVALTGVWIVGVSNALNLLDNMDGLASGAGLIAASALGWIFAAHGLWPWAGLCAVLAGALLGFLFFNFRPASLFMGDVGSLPLGAFLAVLCTQLPFEAALVDVAHPVMQRGVRALVLAAVLALPLADTLMVMVTRVARGQSVAKGGRDHASHRLVRWGASEVGAVGFLWALGACACGAVLWALYHDGPWRWGAPVAALVVMACVMARLGRSDLLGLKAVAK